MMKGQNTEAEAMKDMWLGDLSENGKKATAWMEGKQQSGPVCSLGTEGVRGPRF